MGILTMYHLCQYAGSVNVNKIKTYIINGYVVSTNVFSVSDKPSITELHC